MLFTAMYYKQSSQVDLLAEIETPLVLGGRGADMLLRKLWKSEAAIQKCAFFYSKWEFPLQQVLVASLKGAKNKSYIQFYRKIQLDRSGSIFPQNQRFKSEISFWSRVPS